MDLASRSIRFSLSLSLLIALFASGCRHLSSPSVEAVRPFKDYVLVYSLPSESDPAYARLNELFGGAWQRSLFKELVPADAYKQTGGPAKIMIFGTPDTNPLVGEALRELGVAIGERTVAFGRRGYTLAPYAFTARFQSCGKEIFLVAGPKFADLPEPFTFFHYSMPAEGSYQLWNDEYQIVEQGSVRLTDSGCELRPRKAQPQLAFTPEQRVKELGAAFHIPSGPEDFSFIDRIAAGQKITFIGEGEHHDAATHRAAIALSLHLRRQLDYSALLLESYYSLWPYMEARSLGTDAGGEDDAACEQSARSHPLPAYRQSAEYLVERDLRCGDIITAVADHNRGAPANKKLLCTASDIDDITVMQTNTVRYLSWLAARSSSSETRSNLTQILPALFGLKEPAKLHAYVDEVERRFRAGWSSFLPTDQDEIAFTLSLEHASIDWQRDRHAGNYRKTRGECFRRTIARALAKAERANGGLICFAGGAHTEISYPGDWPLRLPEARYFSANYASTKGRVVSVLIEHANGDSHGPLAEVALALMGKRDRAYVDLRDNCWAAVKNRPFCFSPTGPKYDGILIIK